MGATKKSRGSAKNDEVALEERRLGVSKMYLEGKTQFEIARHYGVSQPCIHNDLKALREQWLAASDTNFGIKQAQEIAKIDHIEALAAEAFAKSLQDAETYNEEVEQELRSLKDDEGKPTGETTMTPTREVKKKQAKGQSGNCSYLDTMLRCVELRCKLWGLIKKDDNPTGQQPLVFIFDQLYGRPEIKPEEDQVEKALAEARGTSGASPTSPKQVTVIPNPES